VRARWANAAVSAFRTAAEQDLVHSDDHRGLQLQLLIQLLLESWYYDRCDIVMHVIYSPLCAVQSYSAVPLPCPASYLTSHPRDPAPLSDTTSPCTTPVTSSSGYAAVEACLAMRPSLKGQNVIWMRLLDVEVATLSRKEQTRSPPRTLSTLYDASQHQYQKG